MQPNGAKIAAGEIWLLTDSRIFGGIDSHIIELAKGLHNHQQSVRVVLTQTVPTAQSTYRKTGWRRNTLLLNR